MVNPLRPRLTPEDLLEHSRCRDAQGEEYHRLGGWSVYTRPDLPIRDEARWRAGSLVILREAFLWHEPEVGPVRVKPGDTVLDLGGNIGTSALVYSRRAGRHGKVFSFEPLTHSVLRRNAERNRAENIEVIPAAVGEECGELDLTWSDSLIDSSVAYGLPGEVRTIRVPVTTVDDFVRERGLDRVDVIKMDIEGAEELALRGAVETIRKHRPRWMISSYHPGLDGKLQHPRLVEILKGHGLHVEEIEQRRIFAW